MRIDQTQVDKVIEAALSGGRVPKTTILALALLWDCAEPPREPVAESLRERITDPDGGRLAA